MSSGCRVDFSDISQHYSSAVLPSSGVKDPSKVLPPKRCTTKRTAFRSGVKMGTGAAGFYKLGSKIKELFGLLPPQEHGKLADAVDKVRNEARTLFADITKQIGLTEASNPQRVTALYFLETDLKLLGPAVQKLKMYMGLLKGRATIGCYGFVTSAKTDVHFREHSQLKKKANEGLVELGLLEKTVADSADMMRAALKRVGIDGDAFCEWKRSKALGIEVSLNTARGAGRMVGVAIQGTITSAIHFGIAVAVMNPALFAAGAYYAVTTSVRVGGIAVKTVMENHLLRHVLRGNSPDGEILKKLELVEQLEKLHVATDAVVQKTLLNIAIAYVSLPVGALTPPGTIFYHATNLVPATHYQNSSALQTVDL